MKSNFIAALLAVGTGLLITPALRAGNDPKDSITPVVAAPAADNVPVSQEFLMEGSYSGGDTIKQGNATLGDETDIHSHVNYVVSPQIKDGFLLRLGVDWERESFGLFPNAPLPNTLQSVNAIIGADFTVSDKIIMRVEAHPGIYSDWVNISSNDIDCPVQIGGTYLYSKDLQFILGIQVDLKSNLPVIGLPGVRWQFADKWVLSAIPPKPQLQYLVNNSLTLYAGGELNGGTYQMNSQFGSSHGHGPNSGNSQLNNAVCDFAEFRVGPGLTWKFTPNMSLDVSGGYIPYRSFEMHSGEIGFSDHWTAYKNDIGNGAPYGEVGISGSF
jgi:hypothetical protein